MQTLWQDLRYGARMLRKHPGFTLIAVATLALGIGANATIFSLANAVLLRPLPIAEPERVMSFYSVAPDGTRAGRFSWLDFADYRAQSDAFAGLSAQMQTLLMLGASEQAEPIFGEVSDGNYFTLLGVKVALGRTFTAADDQTGAPRVAVISYSLWQRRFAGDPAVVGQTIHLNGQPFTIIGVLQEGYTGTRVVPPVEAWVPLQQSGAWLGADWQTNRGSAALQVIGRLQPGISRAQAQASLQLITQRLTQTYPATNKATRIEIERTSLTEGRRRTMVTAFLAILLAVTGLVLLLACANVANLLLARAMARRREMAVRQALGASRWRLLQQAMIEGVLLALPGGFVGLLLSLYAGSLLSSFELIPTFRLQFDLRPDARVLGFSLLISLLTGIVLSVAPALQSSRPDLVTALKDDARGGTGSRHKARLRNSLVVAQTAISLLLLVGAGLLLRSLQNMQAASPGFDPNNVLAMDFDLSLKDFDETQGRRYYQTMLERISHLPGVQAVSLSNRAPLDISTPTTGVQIEGHFPPPGRDDIPLSFYRTTPGYFQTMRIPLLRGRDFTERDNESAPRVALINETMARRFFADADALGKRFRLTRGDVNNALEMNTQGEVEIIGVVKDSKYRTLGEEPTPLVYLPFWQNYNEGMALLVRAAGAPEPMLRTVRSELLLFDQEAQGFFARTMHEHMAIVMAPGKLAAAILSVSGVIALLLAALGLYGVISYAVSQRLPEMGIRLALGAQARDLLRLVLGQGLRLALLGIGVGVLASWALTRFLASLLFGVGALDPLILVAVALLLALVALLACWLPARRATKVDPMIALRTE